MILEDFGGNYEGEKMEKMAENSLLYTTSLLEDFLKETTVNITLKLENTRRLQE